MSNDILAEMKKMMVLIARWKMVSENSSHLYFALIADEKADISRKEQLSISFRTVFSIHEISENFIKISLCTDALLRYITDIFI